LVAIRLHRLEIHLGDEFLEQHQDREQRVLLLLLGPFQLADLIHRGLRPSTRRPEYTRSVPSTALA